MGVEEKEKEQEGWDQHLVEGQILHSAGATVKMINPPLQAFSSFPKLKLQLKPELCSSACARLAHQREMFPTRAAPTSGHSGLDAHCSGPAESLESSSHPAGDSTPPWGSWWCSGFGQHSSAQSSIPGAGALWGSQLLWALQVPHSSASPPTQRGFIPA